MPGIDLIDLSDPLLRKREKNALRLITHPDDKCPDELGFWYLWTAKEAVFKLRRELINFDPKEIPISITSTNDGITFTSGNTQGFFKVDEEVILAIAHTSEEEVGYEFIQCEDRDQSTKLRQKLTDHLLKKFDIVTEISSDGDGLPVIKVNNQPVSLTHHYHHMAFAYDAGQIKKYLAH